MKYPIIIIGAGPSGLSIAHYLKEMGIEFIIFEKGTVGDSWKNQRWEHMVLNTPNSMNLLPGMKLEGKDSDGFISAKEFHIQLKTYAEDGMFNIIEHAKVKNIQKNTNAVNDFIVEVEIGDQLKIFTSSIVVAASGAHIQKITPPFSNKVPNSILQIHSSEYKSTSILKEGAVLVVGSAQSGMQITRELVKEGRKVYLATSKVGRIPRKYRGKDIENWLQETGFYSEKIEHYSNLEKADLVQPQIAVTDENGIEMGWDYLINKGVQLIGSLNDIDENRVYFNKNVVENIDFGQQFVREIQLLIDNHIKDAGLKNIPVAETTPGSNQRESFTEIEYDFLNIKEKQITNIIWTTGLKEDYGYLNTFIENSKLKTSRSLLTNTIEGLYFLGVPFQRTRKSGILLGIVEDSKFIAESIKKQLKL